MVIAMVRIYVESPGEDALPRPERPTVLRGQLTILCMRAEYGIPLTVESIARAEQHARALEIYEVAA
jgi:hypothetical protein